MTLAPDDNLVDYNLILHGDNHRILRDRFISAGQSFTEDYRYTVHAVGGTVKYSADVRQEISCSGTETVVEGDKNWQDCLVVRTVKTDTFSDGRTVVKRSSVWYALNVGPVKIMTGIPPDLKDGEGEATGYLNDYSLGKSDD